MSPAPFLACSAIGWSGQLRPVSLWFQAAGWTNRWQGQFLQQSSGFRKLSFRFGDATLCLMQSCRRLWCSRHVGFHVVAAVVIQSGVEVLFRPLEVAELRVPLTKSLCDECNCIIIAYRIGVRQGPFHVVYRLGISTQESGNGESGANLVGQHLRAL